jgi:hypothetical protein
MTLVGMAMGFDLHLGLWKAKTKMMIMSEELCAGGMDWTFVGCNAGMIWRSMLLIPSPKVWKVLEILVQPLVFKGRAEDHEAMPRVTQTRKITSLVQLFKGACCRSWIAMLRVFHCVLRLASAVAKGYINNCDGRVWLFQICGFNGYMWWTDLMNSLPMNKCLMLEFWQQTEKERYVPVTDGFGISSLAFTEGFGSL